MKVWRWGLKLQWLYKTLTGFGSDTNLMSCRRCCFKGVHVVFQHQQHLNLSDWLDGRRQKKERWTLPRVMCSAMKHPDTIRRWGFFKVVGSLVILPQNIATKNADASTEGTGARPHLSHIKKFSVNVLSHLLRVNACITVLYHRGQVEQDWIYVSYSD